MKKQYRQGDVLLIAISDEEFNVKGFIPSENKTVALGEATGHHHTFEGDVDVFVEEATSNLAVNMQGMLVDVHEDCVLIHQEHARIAIPKGKYRRVIQREYSPEAIHNVAD
jgi:hypothetical protein